MFYNTLSTPFHTVVVTSSSAVFRIFPGALALPLCPCSRVRSWWTDQPARGLIRSRVDPLAACAHLPGRLRAHCLYMCASARDTLQGERSSRLQPPPSAVLSRPHAPSLTSGVLVGAVQQRRARDAQLAQALLRRVQRALHIDGAAKRPVQPEELRQRTWRGRGLGLGRGLGPGLGVGVGVGLGFGFGLGSGVGSGVGSGERA